MFIERERERDGYAGCKVCCCCCCYENGPTVNLPVLLRLRLKCVDDIVLQALEEFFVRRVVFGCIKLCLQ